MVNKTAEQLYSTQDLESMQVADKAYLPGKNRVEELINYAKLSGTKRIGIANCISMNKEVANLKSLLSADFEVFTVDCRYGRIPNAKILGADAKGTSCNPAGQADFLAQNNTQLNISMGLCIGHDIIFNQKSKVPVTTLVVKDRVLKHNPLEALKN